MQKTHLQVTTPEGTSGIQTANLKVEVQGWGFGVGMRRILRKKDLARRWRKSQNPHPQRPRDAALNSRACRTHPIAICLLMSLSYSSAHIWLPFFRCLS